jgi:hypothetical protein
MKEVVHPVFKSREKRWTRCYVHEVKHVCPCYFSLNLCNFMTNATATVAFHMASVAVSKGEQNLFPFYDKPFLSFWRNTIHIHMVIYAYVRLS